MREEPRQSISPTAWLLAVVAGALLLRLVYVLHLEPRIFWPDGLEYSGLAQSLLSGAGYARVDGSPSAFWPPGYPLVLMLIYALGGSSVVLVRIVQSVLSAGHCLIVYGLTRRLVGERPARWAALFTAIYPLYIYAAGAVYPIVQQTLLVTGAVWCLVRAAEHRSWPAAALAGLLGGAATLTAASVLPGLLLGAAWLLWSARRARGRGLTLVLAFLVPLALVVGTWSARNVRVMGAPILVSTNGGINFWLGNYPGVQADTGNRITEEMRRERAAIHSEFHSEVDCDRAFYARGKGFVRDDPLRFLGLSLAKALNFWRLYPKPMTTDRPGASNEHWLSILSYGLLLPFGIYALLVALRRRQREAFLILMLCVAYTAVHAIYISKVRLRLPLDTFVILYGAAGLVRAWDTLIRRRPPGG